MPKNQAVDSDQEYARQVSNQSQNRYSLETLPIRSSRSDRVTALYLGCKTNDLPGSSSSIWLPIYRCSWDDDGYFYYSYTKAFRDNYERLIGHFINPNCGFKQVWKTKHFDFNSFSDIFNWAICKLNIVFIFKKMLINPVRFLMSTRT